MSELKAGDKVIQKMTRDGAVEINKATGGAENISARNAQTDLSPGGGVIGGIVERVGMERRISKKKARRKSNRKIFEKSQDKPETMRENFTDAERKDPAMRKVIRKSDKAANRYEKARDKIPKETVLAIERVPAKQDKRGGEPPTAKPPPSAGRRDAPTAKNTGSAAKNKQKQKQSRLQFSVNGNNPDEKRVPVKQDRPGGKPPTAKPPQTPAGRRDAPTTQKTGNAAKGKQKKKQPRQFSEKSDAPGKKHVSGKESRTETRLVFKERDRPPNGKLTHVFERPTQEVTNLARNQTSKYEKDNVGVEAFNATERKAGSVARVIGGVHSKLQFEPQRKLLQAEKKAVKANVNTIYKRDLRAKPELKNAGVLKKAAHKRSIKKTYAQAVRQSGKNAQKAAQKSSKALYKLMLKIKLLIVKTVKAVAVGWKVILIAGALLLFIILLAAGISLCLSMFGGGGISIIATSYTAEDADILGADEDYAALQNELSARIANIPGDYPGYDEYNFSLDPIGHDPFELASYLTAVFYMYTRDGVQSELTVIIAAQYTLTLTPVTEIRTRTETQTETYTDDDGVEQEREIEVVVEYEYYILNIFLANHGIEAVATSKLTPEQLEMYYALMETKGNKPELFP